MPDADLKIFFKCSTKEKAKRRLKEFKKINKRTSEYAKNNRDRLNKFHREYKKKKRDSDPLYHTACKLIIHL